jgi:hypothetical protein
MRKMAELPEPFGGRPREEYEQLLLAKLQPAVIRSTLSFAGLYQMTHEMLKQAILDRVRDFYCTGFNANGFIFDEISYQGNVIDAARSEGWIKNNKQVFAASAAWLVRMEAISTEQAKRLQDIYGHRHELTHELASFIVDPDRNLDAQMFVDAVAILRDVHRFWVSVERDIGMFEHLGDISLDEVTPLSLMLLQSCIDAYLEDPQAQGS